MKVGIITILKVNNYGAELQAYATQAILKKLGYDAEIIDYLFYKNPKFIRTKNSSPVFRFPLKKHVLERIYPILSKLKSYKNNKARLVRDRRFEEFHRKNTSMSVTFKTFDELNESHLNYDVYIVGSDQVWNPGVYSSLDPYFLTFAPEGKKRISYASSFGVSSIPEYAKLYYKKRLSEFDAISVRESNAVPMVKELSGNTATWVLDPTLLLNKEEWLNVATFPFDLQDKYILIYELTPCPYVKKLALYLRKELGYRIIRICKHASYEDKESDIINIIDAGPSEFIGLFEHASVIVTNSFHGSAFSINFEKDFYTVIPKRKINNSRQESLLKLFGLEHRMVVENSSFPSVDKLSVDYNLPKEIIKNERAKSIKFLTDAING